MPLSTFYQKFENKIRKILMCIKKRVIISVSERDLGLSF